MKRGFQIPIVSEIPGFIYREGSAVKKLNNAIHRINLYPLDSAISFAHTYPLDSEFIRWIELSTVHLGYPLLTVFCRCEIPGFIYREGSAVKKLNNAIHRINLYPLDSAISFAHTYPLDSEFIRWIELSTVHLGYPLLTVFCRCGTRNQDRKQDMIPRLPR